MKDCNIKNCESSLLLSIKKDAPKIWEALENAQSSGLVFIDEKHDSITATNRLLLTYPDLHEVINQLVDHWSCKESNSVPFELTQIIKQIGGDY